MSDNVDIEAIFKRAFDSFELAFGTRVSDDAREALLNPVREHRDEVLEELRVGIINEALIHDRTFAQLRVALAESRARTAGRLRESASAGATIITGADADGSIKKKCEWLFWC